MDARYWVARLIGLALLGGVFVGLVLAASYDIKDTTRLNARFRDEIADDPVCVGYLEDVTKWPSWRSSLLISLPSAAYIALIATSYFSLCPSHSPQAVFGTTFAITIPVIFVTLYGFKSFFSYHIASPNGGRTSS